MDKMLPEPVIHSRCTGIGWSAFRPWVLAWLGMAAGILVGVLYLDHPVALYLLEHASRSRPVRLFVRVPEVLAVMAISSTLVIGFWWSMTGRIGAGLRQMLSAGLGVCVALAAKTELKLVFGRVAPDTWFWHQSAPLRNFHFLYSGCFPSGHMVVMGVMTAFLWPCSKVAVRSGWLLLSVASGTALMMMGAHFLTDLLAGAMLGLSIGAVCRHIATRPTEAEGGFQ